MAISNKAPVWQRVVSGLLALGVLWAFASFAINGELDTWLRVGSMLVALLGGYLFGDFALRGHRAWSFLRGTGDA